MTPRVEIAPRHQLYSAAFKIERARQELDALDLEIEAFLSDDTYRVSEEVDTDKGLKVYRVEPLVAPPSARWGVFVGEIVHNLRSALDHIVWQLALLKTKTESPHKGTSFPIFTVDNSWSQGMIDASLKDVPDDAKQVIKTFQPYNAGDAAESHALWILHSLWNTDKHQTVQALPFALEWKIPKRSGVSANFLNNGGVEVFIPLDLDEKIDFKPDVSSKVTFPMEGPVGGADMKALRHMHDVVRDRVLPVLAGFFTEPNQPSATGVDERQVVGHWESPRDGDPSDDLSDGASTVGA
jgi:hypothetical protein